MQYAITFKNGHGIFLSEEEYESLLDAIQKEGTILILEDNTFLRISEITYTTREEEATAAITKPPTPAEMKAQEERNKEADDITLDGQLSKL